MEDIRELTVDEAMDNEEFVINNDRLAEWALKKILAEKKEMDRICNDAAEEITYYEAIQNAAEVRFSNRTGYLKGKLLEYFFTVDHAETKTQESYRLPSGSLVQKKPKLDLEHDDEKLVEWLEQSANTEYIKVTKKPAWADIKKGIEIVDGAAVFRDTGEIVEGVSVIEKPGSFEVKL